MEGADGDIRDVVGLHLSRGCVADLQYGIASQCGNPFGVLAMIEARKRTSTGQFHLGLDGGRRGEGKPAMTDALSAAHGRLRIMSTWSSALFAPIRDEVLC